MYWTVYTARHSRYYSCHRANGHKMAMNQMSANYILCEYNLFRNSNRNSILHVRNEFHSPLKPTFLPFYSARFILVFFCFFSNSIRGIFFNFFGSYVKIAISTSLLVKLQLLPIRVHATQSQR